LAGINLLAGRELGTYTGWNWVLRHRSRFETDEVVELEHNDGNGHFDRTGVADLNIENKIL
jgi:hypothetical protein